MPLRLRKKSCYFWKIYYWIPDRSDLERNQVLVKDGVQVHSGSLEMNHSVKTNSAAFSHNLKKCDHLWG